MKQKIILSKYFKYIFISLSIFFILNIFTFSFFYLEKVEAQTDISKEDILRAISLDPNLFSRVLSLISKENTISYSQIIGNYYFNSNLSLGVEGQDILILQRLLNSNLDTALRVPQGLPGSIGYETFRFGPATEDSVKRFQQKYANEILYSVGLTYPTGIVGPSTRNKLNFLVNQKLNNDQTLETSKNLNDVSVRTFLSGGRVENSKLIFESGKNIQIAVEILNSGGQKSLSFGSGCQTGYVIKKSGTTVFDSMDNTACITVLTSISLGPNLVKRVNYVHNLSNNPLNEGDYTLEAYIIGYETQKQIANFSIIKTEDGDEVEEAEEFDFNLGNGFGGYIISIPRPCISPNAGIAVTILDFAGFGQEAMELVSSPSFSASDLLTPNFSPQGILPSVTRTYILTRSTTVYGPRILDIHNFVLGTWDGEITCVFSLDDDGRPEHFLRGRNVRHIGFGTNIDFESILGPGIIR